MARDAEAIWRAVLAELQLQMNSANFETWLKDTHGISFENKTLIVGAQSPFVVEWLRRRLLPFIKRALRRVCGEEVEVEFKVWRGGNGHKDILSSFNPRYTFSTFIRGESNWLAFEAAQLILREPGSPFNPLYIFGGTGVGKTHLLHAIGHEALRLDLRPLYMTSEQFTGEFISCARERKVEGFRARFGEARLLLLDDIHLMNGKGQTQEVLFHILEEYLQTGRQVVVTGDRPPRFLPLSEKLRSRLEGGLMVDIHPPDLETRVAILQAKARERKLSLPLEVIYIIVKRCRRNVRELEGVLNALIARSRLLHSPPSPELALEVLREMGFDDEEIEDERNPSPEEVLERIAAEFEIPIEALKGRRKDRAAVLARRTAILLLREELALSWGEIGRALGGKDYSTLIQGYEKARALTSEDSSFAEKVERLRAKLKEGKSAFPEPSPTVPPSPPSPPVSPLHPHLSLTSEEKEIRGNMKEKGGEDGFQKLYYVFGTGRGASQDQRRGRSQVGDFGCASGDGSVAGPGRAL